MTATLSGTLAYAPGTILTIDSGVIEVTQFKHIVAAETGITDILNRITPPVDDLTSSGILHQPEILLKAQTGHAITIEHGTGNILFQSLNDFTIQDGIILHLYYDGTNWADNATSINVAPELSSKTFSRYATQGSAPTPPTAGFFNHWFEADGQYFGDSDNRVTGPVYGAQISEEKTIASDAITLTTGQYHYSIDTELDAASDNLSTITGFTEGMSYYIFPEHTDRTIVIKHGVGNLYTLSGDDVTLDNTEKGVEIHSFDGTNGVVMGTSGGGALPTTTKGDLIVHNGSTDVRLPVGADGQVLTADSADAEGLSYKSLPSNMLTGMDVFRISASTLGIRAGSTMVGDAIVNNATVVQLDLSTNTNWMNVIANGTFDTDTVWDKGTGWTISGGTATHAAGSVGVLSQFSTVENGTSFEVKFTVSGRTAGSLTAGLGAASGTPRTTNGTFTETIASLGSDFILTATSDFDGSVDDVTVTPIEASSRWTHAYVDGSGNYKLFHRHPLYPVADTSSRVFTALVNQASSLNPSTIVYDGGVGGASVEAGMYLFVYDEPTYALGRGKGSGAAATVNDQGIAMITATTGGAATGTLTVDTNGYGHQIYVSDDDYIFACEGGAPIFTYIGGVWYRWLGMLYNDSSGDLVANNSQYGHNRTGNTHRYTSNDINWTTSSITFTDVDATDLVLNIRADGDHDILLTWVGSHFNSAVAGIYFEMTVNGVAIGGGDGLTLDVSTTSADYAISTITHLLRLYPGTHEFRLQWRVGGGTGTLLGGASGGGGDIHAQFAATEV